MRWLLVMLLCGGLCGCEALALPTPMPPMDGEVILCSCTVLGYGTGPRERPVRLIRCPQFYEECVRGQEAP